MSTALTQLCHDYKCRTNFNFILKSHLQLKFHCCCHKTKPKFVTASLYESVLTVYVQVCTVNGTQSPSLITVFICVDHYEKESWWMTS